MPKNSIFLGTFSALAFEKPIDPSVENNSEKYGRIELISANKKAPRAAPD